MRIAQLSEVSGVPVPSIKFYVRDGLMPKGRITARNQADYGQEHVDRLRLIRALTGICRLPLDTTVREVLAAIDNQWPGRGLEAVADVAPTVDDIMTAASMLGVEFQLDAYRQAAEMLEQVEGDMCAEADSQSMVLTSLLGDALIVAMRNQVRTAVAA